ncbi:iron ABC transporter permease [Amycolatopsis sp. GM8]|uniref:ABC transporter permease n=1 Tax=Amycolatopsis sp. GM8 TaxID=2896530 RepID=UPI001F01396F|nr:ABC transporter permease subunit [Amycolatopsis sp. GM8]
MTATASAPQRVTLAAARRPARRRGLAWVSLALVMAVLIIWPLVRLELRAFDNGGDAFTRMVTYPGIGRVFLNTLIVAVGSVLIAVPLGTVLAWLTLRMPPALRRVMAILPIVPLMLPAVAKVAAWTYLLSPRTGLLNTLLRSWGLGSGATGPLDVFTMTGIVVISGVTLTSFVYLFVHSSLEQRGAELEAAAAACGARPWTVFTTVTLPLLKPAVIYSTGIVFLLSLGQFSAPLLLGAPKNIDTISTLMYRVSGDYPVDYALGAALALPLLVIGLLVVVAQRRALGDERRYAAVSGRARQVGVRTSWWAAVPLVIYLLVAVVLPLLALVVVSLSPYWSGRITPSRFTFDGWATAFADPSTQQAISTTAQAVGFTIVLVVPLGYLAALALLQRTRVPAPVRRVIDLISSLALSMPSVLMGFALLLTYSTPPFRLYGTTAMVVVAYVSLMLPHAIRPQLTSMLATGPEYSEASRVAGAGPLATTWRVGFPLIRSGIGVAVSLVVIMVIHEFAVSLMVTSPGRRVIGTLLYDATNFGTAPQVAVIALLMVAITTVGIVAALVAGGARALDRV